MVNKSLQLVVLALASHATFNNSEVRDDIQNLITGLDTDLDTVGFTPSEETELLEEALEGTLNDIAAVAEGDSLLVTEEDEEEELEEEEDEEDEEFVGLGVEEEED